MADYIDCSKCGARLKNENEASHMRKVHPGVAYSPPDGPGSRSTRERF